MYQVCKKSATSCPTSFWEFQFSLFNYVDNFILIKLHCIESECILTVGFGGLENSARSPLLLFTPSPTRVAACVCAWLKYLQLCQALGCVAPARSLVHCTSQGHCCALFCGNYTLQHIIIMCYKRKHWSATEMSRLEIILWAEILSFLLLYLHLNIAL